DWSATVPCSTAQAMVGEQTLALTSTAQCSAAPAALEWPHRTLMLPNAYIRPCVVAAAGKLVILAGGGTSVDIYDPATDRFRSPSLQLPAPRRDMGCAAVGGLVLAGGGGAQFDPRADVYAIDVDAGRLSTAPFRLPRGRHST